MLSIFLKFADFQKVRCVAQESKRWTVRFGSFCKICTRAVCSIFKNSMQKDTQSINSSRVAINECVGTGRKFSWIKWLRIWLERKTWGYKIYIGSIGLMTRRVNGFIFIGFAFRKYARNVKMGLGRRDPDRIYILPRIYISPESFEPHA